MYRITLRFVEQLRDEGYDLWTISLWEDWLTKMPEFETALLQIASAFRNTSLGNGIGLCEANAMDDYATQTERKRQRQLDEKNEWRNLAPEMLNKNYVAPAYFDARGFYFHLPAFLIAELNGQFNCDFIERLIEKHPRSTEWIGLLNRAQADAIVTMLEVLEHHPDFYGKFEAVDRAITRIRGREIPIAEL